MQSSGDFQTSEKFQALMIALGRVGRVYQTAALSIRSIEAKTTDIAVKRREEQATKWQLRILRNTLLGSAYSIAETIIFGLVPLPTSKTRKNYLRKNARDHFQLKEFPADLEKIRYVLQVERGICKAVDWDKRWDDLNRLRRMRNLLIHEGGIGKFDDISKRIDGETGWGSIIETGPIDQDNSLSVLAVGEMQFSQELEKLQCFIHDLDSEIAALKTIE